MQAQANNAMEQAKEAAHTVGEKVTDFFQGNPFASPVGAKIEQATDPTLASENWGLNMEICDFVNMTPEGGRDAIRAIKKRLQTQIGKNNTVVMYTLTVLETCVKNCDQRFQALVCQKDFIQELVKLIGPKYDPPQIVQERVLSLIQSWADAFRSNPNLHGVCEAYDDLKSKGVEFPMTDLDSMAPIITPQKTVFAPPSNSQQPQVSHQPQVFQQPPRDARLYSPSKTARPVQMQMPAGPVHASPEQLTKLRGELDVVNGNMRVLREMLSELAPGQETNEDFQLLQELHKTCREMQSRVVELLQFVTNEEVTSELLVINDEMNNVFIKYDRYMGNRKQGGKQEGAAAAAAAEPSLIDLGAAGSSASARPLSEQLANLSVTEGATGGVRPQQSDGFDMFAQARSTTYEESRQSGSTYQDNSTGLDQTTAGLGTVAQHKAVPINDNEAKEMEEWLKNQGEKPPAAAGNTQDFDAFLNQRASAGDKKEESKEDALFGL